MARLVHVACVPHDPTVPAMLRRGGDIPPAASRTHQAFARLRANLDAARPDILMVVAGDHFNQWFMNNMPQFLVGKARRAQGPFEHEQDLFGLGQYDAELAGHFARHVLDEGINSHLDLAYSNEFTMDHGFVVPLEMLRPEQDLPVVPLFTNVMAPPVPPGTRFHHLGRVLRELIESYDPGLRVAVIASGHMSNSIGGPGMMSHAEEPESEWDRRTWEHLHTGDLSELVKHSTFDSLYQHGNGTPGFLDYVFALGLVEDQRASWSELVSGTTQPPAGFLEWSDAQLNGGAS